MSSGNRCPVYLSESVQPVSSNPVRQRLHSASSRDYIVPRTKTKFGDLAFSAAGPTVWNSLPESVRSAETLNSSLKRKLKTCLSVQHFILIGFYHLIFYQHCNVGTLFRFRCRLGTKLTIIVLYCIVG